MGVFEAVSVNLLNCTAGIVLPHNASHVLQLRVCVRFSTAERWCLKFPKKWRDVCREQRSLKTHSRVLPPICVVVRIHELSTPLAETGRHNDRGDQQQDGDDDVQGRRDQVHKILSETAKLLRDIVCWC